MFRLVRVVVFRVAISFSVVVIVLAGLITNFSDTFLGGFFNFAALGIATALLTLLTLPIMLILPRIRKGFFTSKIAVEIGWTWFLWIMWVAVGGSSASISFVGSCSDYFLFGSGAVAACSEIKALSAFGFITWIVLMFYNITLITLTLRQHFRGNTSVWKSDVTDTDFTATGVNNAQVVFEPKVSPTYATQYPPDGMTPQQTAGSYDQSSASPYFQPHATSPQAQV